VRRTLSFVFASALLVAGGALAAFEITHAEILRPFVLMGALVIIGAAGLWLADEFVLPPGVQGSRNWRPRRRDELKRKPGRRS
jgi:hypothetical protein